MLTPLLRAVTSPTHTLLVGALVCLTGGAGAAVFEGVLEPGDVIQGHAQAEADCEKSALSAYSLMPDRDPHLPARFACGNMCERYFYGLVTTAFTRAPHQRRHL